MIVIKNASVVTPDGVAVCDVFVRDGRIVLNGDAQKADSVIDGSGKFLLPGFIEIHFHGMNLFDFTLGRFDRKSNTFDSGAGAYRDGLAMLRKELAGYGVSSFYAATFAAPAETLSNCHTHLADYLAGPCAEDVGATLRGALLEGSFINPDMAGAQNPEFVFKHCRAAFDSIAHNETIKLINITPEYGQASFDLIRYMTEKGIVVGAGHTNATGDDIHKAADAGLTYMIHFTNGPTGNSFKPFNGGGAVEGALTDERIYLEQICDGYHVNPAYIRDIIARKGADKVMAVTDTTYITGSDIKEFSSGGIKGELSEDGNYLKVVGKVNTLFGSNLTMNRGFKNMLNWLTTDMPGIWNARHSAMAFDQALCRTAAMCATIPAGLTGLGDSGIGTISEGNPADMVLLDIGGKAGCYDVTIEKTFADGKLVYENEK